MVPGNFSELAETVRPGVVNIQVVKKVKNDAFGSRNFPGNPFGENSPFGDFFGPFSEGNPHARGLSLERPEDELVRLPA